MRIGPSTSRRKLGSWAKGDKVEIVKADAAKDWHQIIYNGQLAYVHASYVTIRHRS